MSPELASVLGAVVTSGLLAAGKTLDTKVTNSSVFRKMQPAITLGGALLAPTLAHYSVDPTTFAAAPLATVGAVLGAELLSLFTKKKS